MTGSRPTGPLPLTVISGFLGAGKTTLLNHLIREAKGRRFGVLVNDFGEINIDAELIVGVEDDLVALQGGCICCSMRGDLRKALFSMLEMSPGPEHIVLETSGLSEPHVVRELLLELDRSGLLRLDGIVTLVDAGNYPPPDEARALAESQIRAADLIIINKTDLVSKAELAKLDALIDASTPKAYTENAALPLEALLGLEHDLDKPIEPAGIDADSAFETMSYRSAGTFSFKKLAPLITTLPLVRAKGFVSAEERPGAQVIVHVVGKRLHARTVALDAQTKPESVLVFVFPRAAIDKEELSARLRACETGR